jgi:hypothetical protein
MPQHIGGASRPPAVGVDAARPVAVSMVSHCGTVRCWWVGRSHYYE